MEIKIKKYESKNKPGVFFLGFEIDLGYRVLKIFPQSQLDFADILNLRPQEIQELPKDFCKVFKEVK